MAESGNKIMIVGAVDEGEHYTVGDIQKILASDRVELSRGTNFTGRPETRIHVQDGIVAKLREDVRLSVRSDKMRDDMGPKWVQMALDREREFNIHHPHKTWFYVSDDAEIIPGNLMPELSQLHVILDDADGETLVEHLTKIMSMYARVAAEHKQRLDEGVSNFGLDKAGNLYYLDDETYNWDGFVGLGEGLGGYMRQFPQLEPGFCRKLGVNLAECILEHFPDPNSPYAAARVVRNLASMISDDHVARQSALAEGLESVVRDRRKKRKAKCKAASMTPVKEVPPGDRVALLADVHGNAVALQVVLDKVKELKVDAMIMLGDVVGYGPHPRECIDLIHQAQIPIVKGNHDHAVATGFDVPGTNEVAQTIIEWTRNELTEAELAWLEDIPNYIQQEDWYAVHGAPLDPNYFYAYVYHMTAEKNLTYLRDKNLRFCFHGHSHLYGVYLRDRGGGVEFVNESQDLSDCRQGLICPGSIGKTRGGTPGAEFAVIDLKSGKLDAYHLDYDVDRVIADMDKLSFPRILLDRLQNGM